MTLFTCAQEAAGRLTSASHSREDAQRDVALLARHILGWDAASWLTRRDQPASAEFCASLSALVARRLLHEPVAYLIGEREFFGRTFQVTPAVLIPRPETEGLVEAALGCLAELRPGSRPVLAVDVGTGSGCIAVTLALERPGIHVRATDISRAAIDVARTNAAALGASSHVDFCDAALTGGLVEAADSIVSNPPYVAERERHTLAADVGEFEPSTALFGGSDGLAIIRLLIADAGRALVPGGWLAVEMGHDQADAVEDLVGRAGLTWMGTRADLAGHRRVAIARRPMRSV